MSQLSSGASAPAEKKVRLPDSSCNTGHILISECLSLRAAIGPYKHGRLSEIVDLNFYLRYSIPCMWTAINFY